MILRDRPGLAWAVDAMLWTALAAAALAAFGYHSLLCTFPYQLSATEGGLLQSVRALQAGWDPWSPKLAPEYCNLYGIGYPWVVALLSHAAPRMDLLLLMRLVTAASIFLALGLAYVNLSSAQAKALPALAACLALYATLLFSDTVAARPDGLLIALMLLSLTLAQQGGLGKSALAGALAAASYFVKPTGLLGLVFVLALLIFQWRWRDALGALVAGIVTGGALISWILARYPLYFIGTVAVHIRAQHYVLSWVFTQWHDLAVIHGPLAWGLLAGLAWVLWRRRTPAPGAWRSWAALAGLSAAILAAGPGGHTGAWLTYYDQVWLPLVFVGGTLWLLAEGASPRWVALVLILDAGSVLRNEFEIYPVNSAAQTQAWGRAEAWVGQHPFGYYPPLFTSILAKRHAFITDTGHTHDLERCFWGAHTELRDAGRGRVAAIYQFLSQGKFQSVVCGGDWPCPEGLEKMGYRAVAPFDLRTSLSLDTIHFQVYVQRAKTR
jgi:hypothetical protein